MKLEFEIKGPEKSTSKCSVQNVAVNEGIALVRVLNESDNEMVLKRLVDSRLIQFFFSAQGTAEFVFGPQYSLSLNEDKSLLFYNPRKDLPLHIKVPAAARLVFIFATVQDLHQLFVAGSEEIAFLNRENVEQKYYAQPPVGPGLKVALSQIFNAALGGTARPVYLRAKAMEILSLYFNRSEDADVEQCPFLKDEENVQRIKEAKRILIEQMAHPPTLKELSRQIGLNEYRLKEGFKNVYGKTVFQFLNDYRLDTARHLLDQGKHKVNDAAYQIGYTNPSHFIAAFRKKFGVTPKKYLMQA